MNWENMTHREGRKQAIARGWEINQMSDLTQKRLNRTK